MVKVVASTPSKVRYKREPITPQRAQKLLDTMKVNVRSLRRKKCDEFARDMADGRWQDNGETIKVTPEGELIDGMHRLLAVVKANVTLELTMAYGVPVDAMPTIDTGSARTFGDVLKFGGEANATQLASIVKRLILWRMGHKMRYGGSINPSHSEQEVFYNLHVAELRMATGRAMDSKRQGICNATSAGVAYFLFAELDYAQANAFFDALITGENLTRTNPIHVCRQRLIREGRRQVKYSAMSPHAELFSPSHQLAIIVNAWNFWRTDTQIEQINAVYAKSGKQSPLPLSNENFPEPK